MTYTDPVRSGTPGVIVLPEPEGAPVGSLSPGRLRAEAAKSLVLGFSRVDGKLGVGWAPIRALADVAVEAKRACDKAAKQAAQQGARPWPVPAPPRAHAGLPGPGYRLISAAGPQPKRPSPQGRRPEG